MVRSDARGEEVRTTPIDFAKALLVRLELPITENNVAALVAAQCIEGGFMHNGAMFNPLNTTWRRATSRSVTPVGVQAYESWADGLEATALTLRNGMYQGILDALENDCDPDHTLRAMAVSPWGWYRLEAGVRVPNGIGKAAGYQSYGGHPFPAADPELVVPE
jgi:hypothetical protein